MDFPDVAVQVRIGSSSFRVVISVGLASGAAGATGARAHWR